MDAVLPVRVVPGRPVALTELGLGGAQLGNLARAVTDDEARDAVRAAWGAGIRYFDTAPHYGLGLSERRLGAALRDYPRDEYVVSTKVGRLLEPTGRPAGALDEEGFVVPATARRVRDYSRDGVLRSLEASLERLGLDRVDVVLVHDPDDHLDEAIGRAAPALSRLRDEGVIGAYGAGMNHSAPLARFVRQTDADVVMVAGRYSLLDRSALDDLLPVAAERGVAVVNAGVFNSGLLARRTPSRDDHFFYRPADEDVLDRASRVAAVCERHGVTLPAAALAFALCHPAVVSAVLGLRTAWEVEETVALRGVRVPEALWADLQASGLLPAGVP